MSKVYFISDLHLGHKNILNFTKGHRFGTSVDTHDFALVSQWNSVVTNRDTVWVLGDVCFDIEKMPLLEEMNGNKKLVLGNHDKFDIGVYLKYFSKVAGLVPYKGYWLSHAPIHPNELRGRKNIHGHVHLSSIEDERYINVCVEMSAGVPRTLEQLDPDYE